MQSSTAYILGALSQAAPALPKRLVRIPQRCYGIMTPATDSTICGLYTCGLNTCTGIVVSAGSTENKHVVLCHADSLTNLADRDHGLPAWIRSMPQDASSITIEFDNLSYQKTIQQIAAQIQQHSTCPINISLVKGKASVLVFRNGETTRGREEAIEYIDEKGYEDDYSNIVKNIRSIVSHSESSPPICVFNGRHVLTQNAIETQQPWVADSCYSSDADHEDENTDSNQDNYSANITPSPSFR